MFDVGQAAGLCYFVMEYVDGVNLRQLIEAGALHPEQALAIVPQICEALQFAHNGAIVHRDIKPENILIDKLGRVKIADFGLAKMLGKAPLDDRLTGTRQVMGTPHYMAPEQMRASAGVDHRADIYSLGVVFYEMLTGELPIGRFEPPSRHVRVDVRLDEVVLRALESEPDRRYQNADEVKTDIDSLTSMRSKATSGAESGAEAVSAEEGMFTDGCCSGAGTGASTGRSRRHQLAARADLHRHRCLSTEAEIRTLRTGRRLANIQLESREHF